MSSVTSIYSNAELALAAYATLVAGDTADPINVNALASPTGAGMSPAQANDFASRYPTIVTQYNHNEPATGFSATVFKVA